MLENIVNKLKEETFYNKDIIFRKKTINNVQTYVIFNEPLVSSDKVSDFIIRSLNIIDEKTHKKVYDAILNNLSNFKITEITTYDDISFFLNRGFTIILVDKEPKFLAIETKASLNRSISNPIVESTMKGSKDAFVEDIQMNIGLIKKRIKSNALIIKDSYIGNYTKTKVSVLGINNLVNTSLLKKVLNKIANIDIDALVDGEELKNIIEKETKSLLPTILTTERPDSTANFLLEGRIAIIIDNCPSALILPVTLNDFFKTREDVYGKSINVTFTRILKIMAFLLSAIGPGIYIALVTVNQEILPTDLLVNFAVQRDGVPFPVFIEAFIMMFSFEIIREADLRIPTNVGSSLSIVGALILGDAAVSAGIVSPIMIIVIATTAICSLPFNEFELINTLRIYRILFMLGGIIFGMVGISIVFIYFIMSITSLESFGTPYFLPFAPFDKEGIKDSIFRKPAQKIYRLRKNNMSKGIPNNEKN